MPERPEYWDLSGNQFKRIKQELELMSNKVSQVCQENGYTNFWSTNDWLGFSFSKKEKLERFIVLELSEETHELFTLRVGVWLMKGKEVGKSWSKKIAIDQSIEKFEEHDFQFFRNGLKDAEMITIENLTNAKS